LSKLWAARAYARTMPGATIEDGHGARAASKGDRTRARIVDRAVARFATDGFRRSTLSAIARDAGLTPAAVYAYFEGKEALFVAAVDHDADALIADALRAVPDGAAVTQRWLAFVTAIRGALADHPLARRVLAGQEPDVTARLLDLPALARLRSDLAADLAAAAAPDARRIPPHVAALGIETLVLALLMAGEQIGPDRDPARLDAVLAVLATLLAP
jgi:AcrR family transcriptional regulator